MKTSKKGGTWLMLKWLRDEQNRGAATLIVTVLALICAGSWTIYSHFNPLLSTTDEFPQSPFVKSGQLDTANPDYILPFSDIKVEDLPESPPKIRLGDEIIDRVTDGDIHWYILQLPKTEVTRFVNMNMRSLSAMSFVQIDFFDGDGKHIASNLLRGDASSVQFYFRGPEQLYVRASTNSPDLPGYAFEAHMLHAI